MADDDDRLRRPELDRTGPNRSFAGIFKNDPWSQRDDFWHQRNGSTNSHHQEDDLSHQRNRSTNSRPQESDHTHAQSSDEPTGSFDNAAASFANVAQQAVDLAYKISEPYLRAGQRAAESYTVRESGIRDNFETPFQGGDAMNQPYGDPMAQMYGQLARSYAEFMVSLARTAYGGWSMGGPFTGGGYQGFPRYRDGAATASSGCCPHCGRPNAQNHCPRCGRPLGQCGCSSSQGATPCCSRCGRPHGQCSCYSAQSQCCLRCGRPHSQCCCYSANPPKDKAPPSELKLEVACPPNRSARISKQIDKQSSSPRILGLRHGNTTSTLAIEKVSTFNGYTIVYVTVTEKNDPGFYYGVVIDGEKHEAIGHVSVEVIELKQPGKDPTGTQAPQKAN
jgi:hypothetical protein